MKAYSKGEYMGVIFRRLCLTEYLNRLNSCWDILISRFHRDGVIIKIDLGPSKSILNEIYS